MVGLQILNLTLLVAWYSCEWNHYIYATCHFHNEREVTSYLGFMRVWNRLCAISDTWSWGEVATCVLYDTEKMCTPPSKSNGNHSWGQHTSSWSRCVHVVLQASLVSFAVNWSPWKNTTSNSVLCSPPEGGQSWCTGQSLCHKNATFKSLCSTKSKPQHKYMKFLKGQATNWTTNKIRMGNSNEDNWKYISTTDWSNLQGEGTHGPTGHDDQNVLS
jgi:hypothetical protein